MSRGLHSRWITAILSAMDRPVPVLTETDEVIRQRIRAKMQEHSLNDTSLAQRISESRSRSQVHQVVKGQRGLIPKSLLEVLDALGLELSVKAKRRSRKRSDHAPSGEE